MCGGSPPDQSPDEPVRVAAAADGQLDLLLTVMSLPNVSVGIIPLMTERPAVASTGFWVFDNLLVALATPTASSDP